MRSGLPFSPYFEMFFVDTFRALAADLEDPKSTYRRSGWFILIYTGNETSRLETVKRIFNRFFELFVINVNIFLLLDSTPYVYTYFPFTHNKCHSAKPELLISFRNNQAKFQRKDNHQFFPSKVHNLYGCELSVITWHDPPFIIFDKDEQSGRVKAVEGIEGLLISVLAQAMNFAIKVVDPQPRDRGAIFENGTLTGVTRMVNI